MQHNAVVDVRFGDAHGVVGFAMRGRGDDFPEVVHEWGGDPAAVLRCCHALAADGPDGAELFVIGPAEPSDFFWALRAAGV